METTLTRILGRSGIEVSPLGLGCWAIGGPWLFNGSPAGWSRVDDAESPRALHRAIDLGVNFFDTAANYGAGHSERLLGKAFKGFRNQVVIATKFGYQVDEAAKAVVPYGEKEEESDVASHLRADLEASLKRLDTDYIDVYQLHVWGLSIERALQAREVLEELIKEDKPTQEWLDALESVREVLTSKGRTLAQGALAWIWSRSEKTVPIPGFKTVEQVEENCKAMEFGPLAPEQMHEIDRVLGHAE